MISTQRNARKRGRKGRVEKGALIVQWLENKAFKFLSTSFSNWKIQKKQLLWMCRANKLNSEHLLASGRPIITCKSYNYSTFWPCLFFAEWFDFTWVLLFFLILSFLFFFYIFITLFSFQKHPILIKHVDFLNYISIPPSPYLGTFLTGPLGPLSCWRLNQICKRTYSMYRVLLAKWSLHFNNPLKKMKCE